jgi:hypothetical protein
MEAMFRLLGDWPSKRKVQATIKLLDEYPGEGLMIVHEDQNAETRWDSMDLPNLVEKFRILHTCRPKTSGLEPSVDVIWEGVQYVIHRYRQDGRYSRPLIPDQMQNIEYLGWQLDVSLFA